MILLKLSLFLGLFLILWTQGMSLIRLGIKQVYHPSLFLEQSTILSLDEKAKGRKIKIRMGSLYETRKNDEKYTSKNDSLEISLKK